MTEASSQQTNIASRTSKKTKTKTKNKYKKINKSMK